MTLALGECRHSHSPEVLRHDGRATCPLDSCSALWRTWLGGVGTASPKAGFVGFLELRNRLAYPQPMPQMPIRDDHWTGLSKQVLLAIIYADSVQPLPHPL